MIIGISGRMGSGKNTVGEIIQKLCITNNGPQFEQKAFAGKLKQIASLLTGIPLEKFENQEFKKQEMSEEWGMTYRVFLQKLGTEAMRDGLHENVWVNSLFSDYKLNQVWKTAKQLNSEFASSVEEYPNWVITDMRFANEMEAVKERGGITIRVTRYKVGDKVYWSDPEDVSSSVYEIAEVYQDFCIIYNAYSEAEVPYHEIKHYSKSLHTSETGLDNFTFDYEILNNDSIEDLVEKVREILINEKIL